MRIRGRGRGAEETRKVPEGRGHRRQRGDARNFDLGDTLAGPCADGRDAAKFVLAQDRLDEVWGWLFAGWDGHQRHQRQSGGDLNGRSLAGE